jgi:peptidoglycan-associated lipoprotein
VEGAKGDDDIYYFRDDSPETKLVNYYLAGTTFLEEDVTRRILPMVDLELVNEAGEVIGRTKSDSLGKFRFEEKLEIGFDYKVVGQKETLIKRVQDFSTIGRGIDQDDLVDAVTDIVFETELSFFKNIFAGLDFDGGLEQGGGKPTIVLEGILYDFDDWRIRPDAARELDKLVEYLRSRPNIKVELGSHTDSRGRDAYNLKLSKRRADAAVEYIVSNGIEPERIEARGYGETQLLIPDAVSEEEHQVNRRTTVTILGVMGSN